MAEGQNEMGLPKRLLILSTLLCALALQAAQDHRHPTGAAGASTSNPAWFELTSSMEKMHSGMASVEPCDDSDVEFVRLMLPHHQGAIDMARTQLLYGRSPEMRRLAQEIITDQQSEIDLMRLWLRKQGGGKCGPSPDSTTGKEH
jgi:uncharacterized protein (DUF305 family)